jgi:hypothetical protein
MQRGFFLLFALLLTNTTFCWPSHICLLVLVYRDLRYVNLTRYLFGDPPHVYTDGAKVTHTCLFANPPCAYTDRANVTNPCLFANPPHAYTDGANVTNTCLSANQPRVYTDGANVLLQMSSLKVLILRKNPLASVNVGDDMSFTPAPWTDQSVYGLLHLTRQHVLRYGDRGLSLVLEPIGSTTNGGGNPSSHSGTSSN